MEFVIVLVGLVEADSQEEAQDAAELLAGTTLDPGNLEAAPEGGPDAFGYANPHTSNGVAHPSQISGTFLNP